MGMIKNNIVRMLNSRGFFHKSNLNVVDFTGLNISPEEAIMRAGISQALIDVDRNDIRIFLPLAFRCGECDYNPLIDTARLVLNNNNALYNESEIYKYYYDFQPSSLADLLGVRSTRLSEFSYLSFQFPWNGLPLNYKSKISRIKHENKSHGFKSIKFEGWHLVGPLAEKKIEHEFYRVKKLLKSILETGYSRSSGKDGDICAQVLKREGNYVFVVSPGQHRAAVLSALKYQKIPIRIGGKKNYLIDKCSSDSWPMVQQGFLSKTEALILFDRIFDGIQPYKITDS